MFRHILLILLISCSVVGDETEEIALGEPIDSLQNQNHVENPHKEAAPSNAFVDSSVEQDEPGLQQIDPKAMREAQLAAAKDETAFKEINDLLEEVESELGQTFALAPEERVGSGEISERQKIVNLLGGVRNELDLAQAAREESLAREYKTGFGFGGRRQRTASGIEYGSKKRWEYGHGHTFRKPWKHPRGHKWSFGHGMVAPESVFYDMKRNSYVNGKRGGGLFGSRSSSSGGGGGWFGRRERRLLEEAQ